MSLENFCFVFIYNLLLWRSIVTCNRCNIVSSHNCLTYTNRTFGTMSFNRKLIKFFGGIFRNWEAMFVLIFTRTSRGFQSSRHASAQAGHGQFTPGSHLKVHLTWRVWPTKQLNESRIIDLRLICCAPISESYVWIVTVVHVKWNLETIPWIMRDFPIS